jgi:hypothetical protein
MSIPARTDVAPRRRSRVGAEPLDQGCLRGRYLIECLEIPQVFLRMFSCFPARPLAIPTLVDTDSAVEAIGDIGDIGDIGVSNLFSLGTCSRLRHVCLRFDRR